MYSDAGRRVPVIMNTFCSLLFANEARSAAQAGSDEGSQDIRAMHDFEAAFNGADECGDPRLLCVWLCARVL